MKIIIDGLPHPLRRARLSGKFFYDPDKSLKKEYLEKFLLEYIKNKDKLELPLTKMVSLDLFFSFKIPKSYSKKKHYDYLNKPHTNHKDLDNLIKFVCDALNKKVWIDDAIIYKITARKIWSDKDYTEIEIND